MKFRARIAEVKAALCGLLIIEEPDKPRDVFAPAVGYTVRMYARPSDERDAAFVSPPLGMIEIGPLTRQEAERYVPGGDVTVEITTGQ